MTARDTARTFINERLLARTPLRLTTRGLSRRPQWTVAILRVAHSDGIQRHAEELATPTFPVRAIPRARLLADPFLIRSGVVLHLFFEVQRFREPGRIHHASSTDGVSWMLTGDVLVEPFHLSYPQVFEADGRYWILPESQAAGHVRLYGATDFPTRWEFAHELWPLPLADPTVFWQQGLWWMLGTDKSDPSAPQLRLLMSDQLDRGWTEHPSSPVVTDDQCLTRSAGRPFVEDGRLWRLSQDGTERYGGSVLRIPITDLTPDSYIEGPAQRLLEPSGQGWMSLGLHHLDLLECEAGYVAALDGEGYAHWPWEREGEA